MDKAKRNDALIKERVKTGKTFRELGQKYGITAERAQQIDQTARKNGTSFYARLPKVSKAVSNRVRRVTLTKHEVAEKLGIPENKLELVV